MSAVHRLRVERDKYSACAPVYNDAKPTVAWGDGADRLPKAQLVVRVSYSRLLVSPSISGEKDRWNNAQGAWRRLKVEESREGGSRTALALQLPFSCIGEWEIVLW
jgi:hypothetical protein